MRIMLAPREGVVEHHVRDILTRIGGLDGCVTEFIRVTDQKLPYKVFYKYAQELESDCKTPNGTPVRVQLLGSKPEPMAINALELVNYGAKAIDLNFGCPAKTVNRHGGGAVLLDEPERVYQVVAAVRRAVPQAIPVSAKMRLGNLDGELALDNARGIEAAGAAWLTVHGRTKSQGYRPPAFWDQIGLIREAISLPVIANGEIWNCEDARRCMRESGCDAMMLGRGAVSDPFLARRLRGDLLDHGWPEVRARLQIFIRELDGSGSDSQVSGRVKQWLNYLRRDCAEAELLYQKLVKLRHPQDMLAAI